MGTWILNGTTVKLEDNTNTVAIGSDTTPAGRKLAVTGTARLALEDLGGEVHNVKAYGAVGDGATDDRRAIQRAIHSAETAGSGIVYFPPGTYRIGDSPGQPDLLTFTKPVQFLGAGPFLSVITTDQPTKNIFHGTFMVTDINDKVRPMLFRDLKLEASVERTAGAAIRQDVAPGSFFQHGIRIGNCHFKGQWIGVQLRGASTAVIENCTFWQSIPGPPGTLKTEADVWIDEQVGGDSTTHLVTGCLFGDNTRTAKYAIKLTGRCGGDRILGNYFVNYDTHIYIDSLGTTSMLIQGNLMETARTAAVRMTGANQQVHAVVTGNAMRVDDPGRCIWVDVSGPGAFVDQITVVGNKLVGGLATTRGIVLSPGAGTTADRWLIAENLLHRFGVAVEANANVTGLMLGSNAYVGNTTDLVNDSKGARGATFLDRVGIGAENSVTSPTKELHIKSNQPVRPRIYLEGVAGTSSPGLEFAFDNVNSRRAAVVGTAVGTSGVQLELFTKPDAGAVAQRLVVDKDGNALWRSPNFQEMISVGLDPPAPTAGRARLFLRDTGAGKTQFCVRFATGPIQVLATEP
jgi:hypothetical protein